MVPHKILMLANSELGQANVFLATAHCLLEQDPEIDLHLASYMELVPVVEAAARYSSETNSWATAKTIQFHALPGIPMFDALAREPSAKKNWYAASNLTPGFWNTPAAIQQSVTQLEFPWTAKEFAKTFGAACDLIEELRPAMVVVDGLFAPGLTAAVHMRKRHAQRGAPGKQRYQLHILSPNSLKDWVHHLEPGAAMFWKWPVASSALSMPLSGWDMALNSYYMSRMIWSLVTDKETPAKIREIQEATGLGKTLRVLSTKDLIMSDLDGVDKVLVGCREEVDFAELEMEDLPQAYKEKIVPLGPIIRPAPPVSEVDPELAAWLAKGPVIYVNLGTHGKATNREALEMAASLRYLIDIAAVAGRERSALRVLWRITQDTMRDWPYEVGTSPVSGIYEILGPEMDADMIRIVDWVKPEPTALLETGHIICSVNHGGANTYYEAICNGVPQVVLPIWLDCYDYANRTERLGLGRWGSKKAKPRWDANELGPVLVEVVLEKFKYFETQARFLADICKKDGGGRTAAARTILDALKD